MNHTGRGVWGEVSPDSHWRGQVESEPHVNTGYVNTGKGLRQRGLLVLRLNHTGRGVRRVWEGRLPSPEGWGLWWNEPYRNVSTGRKGLPCGAGWRLNFAGPSADGVSGGEERESEEVWDGMEGGMIRYACGEGRGCDTWKSTGSFVCQKRHSCRFIGLVCA